jgi:hypothetical protein
LTEVPGNPADKAGDAEPKPGSPEYEKAMAEKFRAAKEDNSPLSASPEANNKPVEKPVRPDNVPEKFWDAEKGTVNVDALLKSYGELESGKGKSADAEAIDKAAADKAAAEAAGKEVAEKAGLDWNSLFSKVSEKGDIEAADYETFEKAGIPRDVVSRYIENEKLRVDHDRKVAYDYIGGEDAANQLLDWAAKNLPEAEKVEFNKTLAGPHWRVAVDDLKTRRAGASKTAGEPSLESGRGSGTSGVSGYQTREDMKADMSNPLYLDPTSKGEAFRRSVWQKAQFASWNINK